MSVLSEQDLAIVRDLVTRARLSADGVNLGRLNDSQGGNGSRELRQGGRHTESPTTEKLSARELEVLELIAEGLTNNEIAHALLVSEEAVKTQTRAVIEKLGARNRTRAAVMFVRSASWTEEKAAV